MSAQLGSAQLPFQLGDVSSSTAAGFTISPAAHHAAGVVAITVQYVNGAICPASGSGNMPITIQSGPGSVSAASWTAITTGANGSGTFNYTQAGISSTNTVFLDSVTGTTESFSNDVVPPLAPTIGTATNNGNGTVTVTSTPNADNGGATVTLRSAVGSLGDVGTTSTPGGAVTVTVSGSNKGSSQTWTVRDSNSAGMGPASASSNALTVVTVPGAPTGVTSVATSGTTATVTGTPPVDTGGSSITGYIADDGLGGHTTTAGTLPRTLTGLTSGVTITPRLKAVNAQGQGAFASGNPITPGTVSTVTMLVQAPYLSTDVIGTKTVQIYQIIAGVATAVGSPVTSGFTAIPGITNGWWVRLQTTPNGSFGDFYGFAVFGNINGSSSAPVELNSPPTSVAPSLVVCTVFPFLASDTIGTPGYQLYDDTGAASGSHVTSGIVAIPGVTNGYAANVTLTPDSNNGAQRGVVWDG